MKPDDDDAPELTAEVMASARRGRDVLPPEILSQFGRRRMGRPPVESPKVQVSVRLDADVLAKLREGGPGWQTRANAVLRSALIVDPETDDRKRSRSSLAT